MIHTEIAIVGGGPAGLCAAIKAAESGAKVIVLDRNSQLGGQLIKQTHMFFGSQKQYASHRGIDIA
ncbi:MAG TPA: FAD-dependent oxidoreductase, partial [Bacillota bacterium]|nr:FAD-dependent oxidoreductase [Bacillota bacterium]